MAIIKCPECGKEISDKSEKCIGCGLPARYFNEFEEPTLEVDVEDPKATSDTEEFVSESVVPDLGDGALIDKNTVIEEFYSRLDLEKMLAGASNYFVEAAKAYVEDCALKLQRDISKDSGDKSLADRIVDEAIFVQHIIKEYPRYEKFYEDWYEEAHKTTEAYFKNTHIGNTLILLYGCDRLALERCNFSNLFFDLWLYHKCEKNGMEIEYMRNLRLAIDAKLVSLYACGKEEQFGDAIATITMRPNSLWDVSAEEFPKYVAESYDEDEKAFFYHPIPSLSRTLQHWIERKQICEQPINRWFPFEAQTVLGEIVKIENGGNEIIDTKDKDLLFAVLRNDKEMVKSLLDCSVNPDIVVFSKKYKNQDIFPYSLLHIAVKLGYLETAVILAKAGADVNIGSPLCDSVERTDFNDLSKLLINQGANINARQRKNSGWSPKDTICPLYRAIESENSIMAEYLLGCGVDADILDLYYENKPKDLPDYIVGRISKKIPSDLLDKMLDSGLKITGAFSKYKVKGVSEEIKTKLRKAGWAPSILTSKSIAFY